jgi:predicted nucleotidyltransferase
MKALNFYNETLPVGEIDLILDSPIEFEELQKKSVKIELGEDRVPVVSILDLIELKLKAGRKQDLADVEHLRAILER